MLNSEGIYSLADFIKGIVKVDRTEFRFPEGKEAEEYTVEGITVCRYWGKKDNLILLLDTGDMKLKFSFWSNNKYCYEPVPKRKVSIKESVRFLSDGSYIRLTYVNKNTITRVRDIKVLKRA